MYFSYEVYYIRYNDFYYQYMMSYDSYSSNLYLSVRQIMYQKFILIIKYIIHVLTQDFFLEFF